MDEQKPVALLPCPFCGGEARTYRHKPFPGMPCVSIEAEHTDTCPIAQAHHVIPMHDTEEEAAVVWNQRVPQPAPDAGGLVDPWLVHQLEAWPDRVDPDKTTNIEFLMKSAAAALTDLQAKLEEAREVEEAARAVVQGYVDGEIKRATWDGAQLIAKLEDALGARHEP